MRHRDHLLGSACPPRRHPNCMVGASVTALLVQLAGRALQFTAAGLCAAAGAVALTPIAVAAHQNLDATTRAVEESSRPVPHEHPRQVEVVLDGIVRGCNTDAAPVIDTV
jgi:hypothetical protein